jgi:Holliday junction DNA helicase RuvB
VKYHHVNITAHGRSEDIYRAGREARQAWREGERLKSIPLVQASEPTVGPVLKPASASERSGNQLRPRRLDQMVGQEKLKPLLREIIAAGKRTGHTLPHMLFTGSAGTGKSTLANIVGNELGRDVYALKAPVALDMFEQLRTTCKDGDVIFVDEIHMQVSGDRRGVTQACDVETFFSIMEDYRLSTSTGMLPFPKVTFIGATTDTGLLPEAFLRRFTLKPRLAPYTEEEMAVLAVRSARALHLNITSYAASIFAKASRATPYVCNTYVSNAAALGANIIDDTTALRVVVDLNSTTLDGLTADMSHMLKFLYLSGRRETRGEVRYQASVNTIATALGHSRDTKTVSLYVEPYLIERGLVQVGHGGRFLTDAGVRRARELVT